MKDQITQLLKEILTELGVAGVEPEVTIPENPAHGDYTTNVAMKIATSAKFKVQSSKWATPREIALQVAEKVESLKLKVQSGEQYQNIEQTSQKISEKLDLLEVLQDIDRLEIMPPGFINFFISEAKLSSQLVRVLKEAGSYGKSQLTTDNLQPATKKVVVEFTDPNPFKEFHVGHLYSNSVGEALVRLLEASGSTVRRANYQGDVGMHVAKAIWALWQQVKSAKLRIKSLEEKPLAERVRLLGQAYAQGARAFEEEPQAAEEMKHLNQLIFIAAQQVATKAGWQPVVNYRKNAEINEAELATVRELYEKGRSWSLEAFEAIYKLLGTKFDAYYFESQVGELGAKIVSEHTQDGVFKKSEGAIVYQGEKRGLHTRVFLNQLGLPTYEAKELGLAIKKYQDWPYDLSLIVTGNEINEYFKVVLAALSEIEPELARKTRHLGHGMVRGPEGQKLSSRTGQVLTGDQLIDEAKQAIYDILQKSRSNYTKEQQETIATKAAVAAVKYSLLKVALPSDIAFDLAKSVSFEGDSGPYLQYTYARCRSVLRKAGQLTEYLASSKFKVQSSKLNTEERAVARLILYFPEVVAEAAQNLSPSIICAYLFTLAQQFNLFYQKHQILGHEARLALTAATAQVLQNGLYLLGIATLEQM